MGYRGVGSWVSVTEPHTRCSILRFVGMCMYPVHPHRALSRSVVSRASHFLSRCVYCPIPCHLVHRVRVSIPWQTMLQRERGGPLSLLTEGRPGYSNAEREELLCFWIAYLTHARPYTTQCMVTSCNNPTVVFPLLQCHPVPEQWV